MRKHNTRLLLAKTPTFNLCLVDLCNFDKPKHPMTQTRSQSMLLENPGQRFTRHRTGPGNRSAY